MRSISLSKKLLRSKKAYKPQPSFSHIGKAPLIGKSLYKYFVIGRKGGLFVLGFCLMLIGLRSHNVFADNFYPSGDSLYCEFAETVSLSISSLPISSDTPMSMTYSSSLVSGEGANYPETHTMLDVADMTYPDAHRYLGVADRVSVPPNTTVDLGYYIFNYSGHDISINDGSLFWSRSNPNDGDITRLGAIGSSGSRSFLLNGQSISRAGKIQSFGNLGRWPTSSFSAPPAGVKLTSFETIQPIHIVSQTVSPRFVSDGRLFADFSVIVKNTSSYQLGSIQYSHGTFGETFNMAPNETKEIIYSFDLGLNYDLNIDLGFGKITDPNYHTECAGQGGGIGLNYNPDARLLLTARDDSGAPNGWSAVQADFSSSPDGDYLCVTLIPYQINTDIFALSVLPELVLTKTASDSDENMSSLVHSSVGEVVTFDVVLKNNGARTDNLSLIDVFPANYFEVVDVCGGHIEENLSWDIGSLAHGAVWICPVKLRIKHDLGPGNYSLLNEVQYCISLLCSNTVNAGVLVVVEDILSTDPHLEEEVLAEAGFNLYKIALVTASLLLVTIFILCYDNKSKREKVI